MKGGGALSRGPPILRGLKATLQPLSFLPRGLNSSPPTAPRLHIFPPPDSAVSVVLPVVLGGFVAFFFFFFFSFFFLV